MGNSKGQHGGNRQQEDRGPLARAHSCFKNGAHAHLLEMGNKDVTQLSARKVLDVMEGLNELMERNAAGITLTQMRKVYGIFKHCESEGAQALVQTRYKLDYLVAKQKRDPRAEIVIALIKDLIGQLAGMTDEKAQAAFESFYTVMEAMVAYHKFYGRVEK